MTFVKWLSKWFIVVALFVFLLTLFAMNMDQRVQVKYYGLAHPITVEFWELVVFSVALGMIVAALGELVSQMKWIGERHRMIKRDREHKGELQALNDKIGTLESQSHQLKKDVERKTQELADLKAKTAIAPAVRPAVERPGA
jgi:hypothetical protein